MKTVSNSSPLVGLAAIGRFPLLRRYFGRIYIPQVVYREVVTRGKGRAGARETKKAVKDKTLKEGKGMKLIVAIVQNQDANRLMDKLAENRFQFTKIGSTGGFLREGNTTLLIGVRGGREEDSLSIIKKNCRSRERPDVMARHILDMEGVQTVESPTVTVGGATVFILNIERWETF